MIVSNILNDLYRNGQYYQWRRDPLEVCVNSQEKLTEIWVTREEKQNAQLEAGLKHLCREYKSQGYFVAVFLSGDRDLQKQTSDLLCFNRKRTAELETMREKQNA